MVQYDKYIINKLLDTYESSLLSTGRNTRTVHVEFRFTESTIPAYFDESSGEYEKIHFWVEDLEEKKLIEIFWRGKKEGHIISKVRLNTNLLKEAYTYVRRVPKSDMTTCQLQMLEEYIKPNQTPVCRAFAEYLLKRLTEHKSVKEFIQIEDVASTRQLLNTIQAVERNETQLYIREFSIIHFQDSKAFEKMESRVSHVFKRFKPNCEVLDYSEILAEYGIYHTPNYVYLKGNLVVLIGQEKIDLSSLKQGLGISGEDISRIRFYNTVGIRKVITIENLTTYFRWQEDDSLLVYLGGYHNSVRCMLLQEIYACCSEAYYYHFGDIDAGGFEIYRNLCEKTGIPFEMYKMNLETLRLYEKYGKPLTETDRKRLQGMRDRDGLQELIHYMLEHDVKLEQECIRCY